MGEIPATRDDPRRVCLRWLLALSVLVTASLIAWLLVAYLECRWLAACVVTAAVGWVLYRPAQASAKGVVLGCLAAVALNTSLSIGDTGRLNLQIPCGFAWLILSLASVLVFLAAALKNPSRRVRNCACCNLALFALLVGPAVCNNAYRRQVRYEESARQTTGTIIALHELGAEIESIRTKLGRLPADEAELVTLRGNPMPTYRGDQRIRYHRFEGTRYELSCSLTDFWGWSWDIFGWIVSYHGPNAPQRIHVILF